MYSYQQCFLSCMCITIGTSLASSIFVNLAKKLTSLTRYITQYCEELTKASIKSMLAKHTFSPCSKINIFNKY